MLSDAAILWLCDYVLYFMFSYIKPMSQALFVKIVCSVMKSDSLFATIIEF